MVTSKYNLVVIATIAVVLGSFASIYGAWDFIEPIAFMASFALSAKVYLQTKKQARASASSSVGDAHVVIQGARPIEDSVRQSEGKIDEVIDLAVLLGKPSLDCDADYQTALHQIFKVLQMHQRKKIHLYVSCPLALAMQVGMITGLTYEIYVYQYDAVLKDYIAVTPPSLASFR